jgi:hypothetical protein
MEINQSAFLGVHAAPCRNCPSMAGTDPEVEDVLTWPEPYKQQTVFPCAWRREKLCRGYCDKIGFNVPAATRNVLLLNSIAAAAKF